MKEAIVTVEDENSFYYNLKVQQVAVQLLYGKKVRSDDLLKISQTGLENILATEAQVPSTSSNTSVSAGKKKKRTLDESQEGAAAADDGDAMEEDETLVNNLAPPINAENRQSSKDEVDATPTFLPSMMMDTDNSNPMLLTAVPTEALLLPPNGANLINGDEDDHTILPYDSTNQLDYLEDGFQLLSLMIKTNTAKLKDDLKKEGTSNSINWYDNGHEVQKLSNRELTAKARVHERRIEARLQRTLATQQALPRLEALMNRFNADTFEKRLVLLLIGNTISPVVRTLLDNMRGSGHAADSCISVGEALSILCGDFKSQIQHRRYFYQSSKLLLRGVITVFAVRWREGTGDLTESRISLDRRILDWTVGLDSEINELVEGSDLYEPMVQLKQVVLPVGHLEKILSQCYAYDDYLIYHHRQLNAMKVENEAKKDFESTDMMQEAKEALDHPEHQAAKRSRVTYGNSLVILLCGKSGTGKTMTVNAVAKELKKKVLLVDFTSLINRRQSSGGGGGDAEVDLKGLFREAKMSNAVLFFDECETIFRSRALGADRVLNSLLTEMERHEGIVFLATNRPHEIDEAMHRRITMVLEYDEPTAGMRRQIWDNLLLGIATAASTTDSDTSSMHALSSSSKAKSVVDVSLAGNVESAVLATKYELTGGFIKNAVLSATLIAMSRVHDHTHGSASIVAAVITMQDLVEGCRMQMRGNLSRNVFAIKNCRQRALSDLYIAPEHKETIKRIIRYEQTRTTVYGTWHASSSSGGGDESKGIKQHACINLIAGCRGSGKMTIVETIASELGNKKTKYIHMAELSTSENFAATAETFKALVRDAAILDAVIVVDGFEQLLQASEAGGGSVVALNLVLSRVMDIMFDFAGCIFLLAHLENPQNIDLMRDFASRLFSFIRVTLPPPEIRQHLWKSLLPIQAPIAKDVDFALLGRKFELFPISIESAIACAASEVAGRTEQMVITQQDLLRAGDREVKKVRFYYCHVLVSVPIDKRCVIVEKWQF